MPSIMVLALAQKGASVFLSQHRKSVPVAHKSALRVRPVQPLIRPRDDDGEVSVIVSSESQWLSPSVAPPIPGVSKQHWRISANGCFHPHSTKDSTYRNTGCSVGGCASGETQTSRSWCFSCFCYNERCRRDYPNHCTKCQSGYHRYYVGGSTPYRCEKCPTGCKNTEYLRKSACSQTNGETTRAHACTTCATVYRLGRIRNGGSLPSQTHPMRTNVRSASDFHDPSAQDDGV